MRARGFANLIIGVTGNAMTEDVLSYEAAGADCVLTKPMRMDQLERLLTFCALYGCHSHHPLLRHLLPLPVIPEHDMLHEEVCQAKLCYCGIVL